jgi:branched-chain amino acid transport system permease protein
MIIIGGLGSIIGSVFGAVFMILLPKLLSVVTTVISADFPSLTRLVAAFEQGIFGLIIVLFLIFEPDGLAHRWRLIKAYWKLYPFSY